MHVIGRRLQDDFPQCVKHCYTSPRAAISPVKCRCLPTFQTPFACDWRRLWRQANILYRVFMSFSALGLSDEIVRAVTEQGYTSPTPIQAQAIPAVLAGGDLLAGAQTGTGKTAGFTLPLLQRLSSVSAAKINGHTPIRALILTPTRELAAQVEESVRTYGKYLKLTSTVIFGGVGINPQIKLLKHGIDTLVATPGRLLDHMQQGTVDLRHVEILILDEADRMLDMGFIRDIRKVLAVLPKKRQNLLFSATFSDEIKALADGLLNAPAMIEVARRNSTVEVIAQKIHPVDRDKKHPLLAHLIKSNNWSQVLVFTRTKHGANKLVEQLEKDGISGMAIHGNKSQSARTRALSEFKEGSLQVLVATDIAARGIDIDQLPHVVNYDLPNVPEDYVHRIGRTGRAGATGEAVSLVCVDEKDMLKDIEKLIKRELPREVVPGFEPDPNARPQPIQLRSGGGGGGRQQQGRGGQGQARSAQTARPNAGGPAKTFGGAPSARPSAPRRSGGRGR
jgi:ATP-dependent RNA helicase RhlE